MPNSANTGEERPILMSAAMALAAFEGRKTQTRRIIAPPKGHNPGNCFLGHIPERDSYWFSDPLPHANQFASFEVRCPFGKPGDRLYVRETWQVIDSELPLLPLDPSLWNYWRKQVRYGTDGDYDVVNPRPWKPSIHMPKWASRTLLEITEVRVERLRDISEADAIAEGLLIQIGGGTGPGAGYKWDGPGYHDHVSLGCHKEPTFHVRRMRGENCDCNEGRRLGLTPARCAFRMLWESLNGPGSWGSLWVWAISFRKLEAANAE